MLTGISIGSKYSRVRGNQGDGVDQYLKSNNEFVFAEILSLVGYRTAGFGKWGFQERPKECGFDYFLGKQTHKSAQRYFAEYLYEDNGTDAFYTTAYTPNNYGVTDGDLELSICNLNATRVCDYVPDVLHKQAMAWLEDAAVDSENTPFFLFYSSQIPHDGGGVSSQNGNIMPIQSYDGPSDCDQCFDYEGRDGYLDKMAALGSAVTNHLDQQIGELASKLDALGIANDTLFIVLSDNGPAINIADSESEWSLILDSPMHANAEFRGYKRQLFEGSLRVPNLFRWPGVITGGAYLGQQAVQMSDLAPTLVELAGIDPKSHPVQFNGVSFASVLLASDQQGDSTVKDLHDYLYHELCWHDQGVIGEHTNCDVSVSFGSNLQNRVEWTARSDLNLSMTDEKAGWIQVDENLTRSDLLPDDYTPEMHNINDEYDNIATNSKLRRAADLVASHRILPGANDTGLLGIYTLAPTMAPTKYPTKAPTLSPTLSPTKQPTSYPTSRPTLQPTQEPTNTPYPSRAPTAYPTKPPTEAPTGTPTIAPTESPPEKSNETGDDDDDEYDSGSSLPGQSGDDSDIVPSSGHALPVSSLAFCVLGLLALLF
ncbi:Arylsulfatase [Hondaea fermentalgiana]|uniref:Arylsulfatase n=1 Tax=Hondaea fermentalgiana TaxID=2315210 RepID=A0A2R5GPG7_9STRA|nr:Arylsulfatase [Hondaea fermentalgiana]|eukprot:GBG32199.1 Arylsulfatase [Hondaea fermentalgiana]